MSTTVPMTHVYKGRHYVYAEDLTIDWSAFRYTDYTHGEVTVLQPQLEAMGFTVIGWHTGEGDSYGPLTRYARITHDGIPNEVIQFVYG